MYGIAASFGIQAVILAAALLAIAGCSDGSSTPADAPEIAAIQAQPTAIPKPTIAPEPTSTSEPTATPEPTPTVQASEEEETLEDLLQNDIVRYSVEILKRDPNMHGAIFLMGWVEDGVSDSEREELTLLLQVALEHEGLAKEVTRTPWVRDGLDEDEYRAIARLAEVASHSEEAALSILAMSFMDSVEPSDTAALESLNLISMNSPDHFDSVMSHPAIADGISDEETPLVTPLHHVIQYNPALTDELLDPGRALVEDRYITLPLTGETRLTIVRTQPGATHSMDLLESAVRAAEDDMAAPFPTNFILLLYADALPDNSDSLSAGTSMVIHSKYDVGEDGEDDEFASRLLADALVEYY